MFISDFAIRRPVITIVSMLALVVAGLISLVLLQTDEFPDVAVPIVVVAVPYLLGHDYEHEERGPRWTAEASVITGEVPAARRDEK